MAYYYGTPQNDLNLAGGIWSDVIYGYEGDDKLFGNGSNDTLYGGEGNDTLDGGSGSDTMDGGNGNDYYKFNATGDKVVEGNGANSGIDTVETTVTLNFASRTDLLNVENGVLAAGTAALSLTGNALANTLTGNDGTNTLSGGANNDTLYGNGGTDTLNGDAGDDILIGGTGNDALNGGTGNDTLEGGSGNDTMTGGDGNDLYYFDNAADKVVEGNTAASGSQDSVISAVSLNMSTRTDLVNVENALLFTTGTTAYSALSLTGNGLANALVGNLGANTLDGGSNNDILSGLDGDDILIGGTGNDTLDGGLGNDVLNGGEGNDTYTIDSLGDSIVEVGTATSIDTIVYGVAGAVSLTGTLALIENASLTAAGNHSLTGNDQANNLVGNNDRNLIRGGIGNDTLSGQGGDDTLNGEGGDDALYGGAGNDTFDVDSLGDTVFENANEGDLDLVRTTLSYSLEGLGEVENIELTGTDDATATGNGKANELTGNSGNNELWGLGGDDAMNGDLGSDVLHGGEGNDYLFAGIDDVSDTLDGGTGEDTMIDYGFSDDFYYVDNTNDMIQDEGGAGDLAFVSTDFDLSTNGTGIEQVVVTGTSTVTITGNALENWLVGNDNRNALIGQDGADTLDGGGDDDILDGGEGDDLLVGGDGDDFMIGANGSDTLDGGSGDDAMFGDAGDDYYYVDSEWDLVSESADVSGGNDTIYSHLVAINLADYAGVEDVALMAEGFNATGSADNNALTGNENYNILNGEAGDDTLLGEGGVDILNGGEGNDLLDGGSDIDILSGGNGDDQYYTDSDQDTVTELADQGWDTLYANNNVLSTENIDVIVLMGDGEFTATGNSLDNLIYGNDSSNLLIGGDGMDYLNGGQGIDRMEGGLGDDDYEIESSDDVIIENADSGTDTAWSSVSYSLSAHVENLNIISDSDVYAFGNDQNNRISTFGGHDLLVGGKGNDRLDGGAGNDQLLGGEGNDLLIGNTGDDEMFGGLGNDTYYFTGDGDSVVELSGQGKDVVYVSTTSWQDDASKAEVEVLFLQNRSGALYLGDSYGQHVYGSTGADFIRDGAGNDLLVGAGGNDTIILGAGNDVVGVFDAADTARTTGAGAGNDSYTYEANLNSGQDRITDLDTTVGNKDVLTMYGVDSRHLWLSQSGQDLVVSVIGTDRSVSIADWYLGDANHIEQITASVDNLVLDHSKVNSLIAVMSTMTPPPMGQTDLTSAQLAQLDTAFANWTTPA